MNPTGVKVAFLNFLTWLGTVVSFQVVTHLLQTAVLMASLILSVCSILWIRQQSSSLRKREAAEEEERKKKASQ